MRVHFIEAYHLPSKLKVSEYLLRSEQQVFIKLVHVSIVAWLFLTGAMNLLYFTMGVLAYYTENSELVGVAMIWIFYSCMVLFVLISLIMFNKMRYIFGELMHRKQFWKVDNDDEATEPHTKLHQALAKEQLSLFWLRDPTLVISAIQSMQFGYAIALSIILIFWDVINDGSVHMLSFVLVLLACYTLFLLVTANIIPRYTLCTSLGQLVNRKHLQETVAYFRLEEAKRKQKEESLIALANKDHWQDLRVVFDKVDVDKTKAVSGSNVITDVDGWRGLKRERQSGRASHHADLLAAFVKLDTSELRTQLPKDEIFSANRRDSRSIQRRLKSVSDGVASMAKLSSPNNFSSSLTSRTSQPASIRTMDDWTVSTRSIGVLDNENVSAKKNRVNFQDLSQDEDRMTQIEAKRLKRDNSINLVVKAIANLGEGRSVMLGSPPEIGKVQTSAENHLSTFSNTESGISECSQVLPFLNGTNSAKSSLAIETCDTNSVATADSLFAESEKIAIPDDEILSNSRQTSMMQWANEHLYELYTSKRFVLLSNVFGTLVAFFFVGQRVERFLHTEGIVSIYFVSFDFDNVISFWLLLVWFTIFIINSSLALVVVRAKRAQRDKDRSVAVGAAMDVFLTASCLVLFLVAEGRRCCRNDQITTDPAYSPVDRMLASSVRPLAKESDVKTTENEGAYNLGAVECDCPTFGSRTYGGLGTIEPYICKLLLHLKA
jgi:hypothetical protein